MSDKPWSICSSRPGCIRRRFTSTAETSVHAYGNTRYNVPKRDLVGVLQVLLHSRRLVFAAEHPMTPVLMQELSNFKVTIDPRTAHDSYAAWREGIHDDLVLATALACWYGEWQDTRRAGTWGR